MKRCFYSFIMFAIIGSVTIISSLNAQTWTTKCLGTWSGYGPMIVADEDGYLHIGDSHHYSNTYAQDPNVAGEYSVINFSEPIPTADASYFPRMRYKNGEPHICTRLYVGNQIGVGYWKPSYGESHYDFYFDWHGHYPSLEISDDGTHHFWFQVDGYGDSGAETNVIYQNSKNSDIQQMVQDSLDVHGRGGLYDYGTCIDKNGELHWLGAVFNAEAGPGRKLYYNHSTNGIFNEEAERLPWDGAFPALAADDNNVIHAVWHNSDIQYSYNDGNGWADAVKISKPGNPKQKWWVHQQISDDNLQAMRPVKDHINYAWVCGNWGIFMTDDNWESFDIQYVDGYGHKGIFPVDTMTVYCVGENGKFWKTVNGGEVYPNGADGWTEYNTGFSNQLNDCWFLDTLKGFAVGNSGIILKTIDGGDSWAQITSPVSNNLYAIDFSTNNTGYIVGKYGKILKTTNGGDTWNPLTSGTTKNLQTVYTLDSLTVWVAGQNSTVRVSTDGGQTWINKDNGVNNVGTVYSIYFLNDTFGYLCGTEYGSITDEHSIYKTLDGGESWVGTIPLTGADDDAAITGIYCISKDTAFACGGTGKIYKGVLGTDAAYQQPGIAIDRNGNIHVTYWSFVNDGWDRNLYYTNNIGGSWNEESLVKTSAYLYQIDGNSKIAFDYNTNTTYIGALALSDGFLVFTRDINIQPAIDADLTTTVTASSALTEPDEIDISNYDSTTSISVLDFTVSDVANDGKSTKIKTINIRKGPESSASVNFNAIVDSAALVWGSNSVTADSIGIGILQFSNESGALVEISEGGSETFTLNVWLKEASNFIDGEAVDFKISAAHDVRVDTSGSRMTTVPSDITSGEIIFSLTPSKFVFSGLPSATIFNSDLMFQDDFSVTAVDVNGVTGVTAQCSDLTLTAVGIDSVTAINGTFTVSPSNPQSLTEGVATFSNFIISEGYQSVRIKATGTVNGSTVITGYSEVIKILPYSDKIILRANSDELHQSPFIGASLTRFGYEYDVLNRYGYSSDPIPETFLANYNMVFIDESSMPGRDSTAINYLLNQADSNNQKSIAIFGSLIYGCTSTIPNRSGLGAKFGIGPLSIYPTSFNADDDIDFFKGVDNDPLGDNLKIVANPYFSRRFYPMIPATDSTNVRICFETTYNGDSTSFVPIGIRHTGTNYKTFRSGVWIEDFGTDENIDTLLTHMLTWFNSDKEESFGHNPGFSNRITSRVTGNYVIFDDEELDETVYFFDNDAENILDVSTVIKPDWLNMTVAGDSIVLTGMPDIGNYVYDTLGIKITDDQGNYSMQYTRFQTRHHNHTPQFFGSPPDSVLVGEQYSYQVTASDPDTIMEDYLTFSLQNVSNDWLSISSEGLLSGIPDISDTGVTTANILVIDNNNASDTMAISITVYEEGNHAPKLTEIPDTSMYEEGSMELILSATDEDNDTLSFFAESDTSAVIATVSNDTLYLSADTNFFGGAIISVSVSDGELKDLDSFMLNVIPVNDPPSLEEITDQDTYEDSLLQITVIANDVDCDSLDFSAWTNKMDDVFPDMKGDTLSITTKLNFNGDALIYIRVSDGVLSDTSSFGLQILPVDDPPYFTELMPDSISFDSNVHDTLSLTGMVSDIDSPDSVLAWSYVHSNFVQCSIDEMLELAIFQVEENISGLDTVILSVSDGQLTVFDSLIVIVNQITKIDYLMSQVPKEFSLEQNYPNPFNPITNIIYSIPKKSHVDVRIYNLIGREIKMLVNEEQEAKYYNIFWDGKDNSGNSVSSGMYFFRMVAQSPQKQYVKTRKMILLH